MAQLQSLRWEDGTRRCFVHEIDALSQGVTPWTNAHKRFEQRHPLRKIQLAGWTDYKFDKVTKEDIGEVPVADCFGASLSLLQLPNDPKFDKQQAFDAICATLDITDTQASYNRLILSRVNCRLSHQQ